MKLIFCTKCQDVVRICNSRPKFCRCKESSGQYIDNINAWYAGSSCIPLGFSNHSFSNALRNRKKEYGEAFEAFVVPLESESFKLRGKKANAVL